MKTQPNIYVTSDTHFGHDKIFLYNPRGFNNIWEHDKTIIENWNKIIKPEDEVFHLGDVMLGNNDYGLSCLSQLNGNIHIILGNHCTDTRIELYKKLWNVVSVDYAYRLRYKGLNFFLTHYPTLTSNYDYDKPLKTKVINLCGHSHTSDPFSDWDKGLIFHTELDTNDCKPWLLDDIIIKIKEKLND